MGTPVCLEDGTCQNWGGWILTTEGPGTVWEDLDAGFDDPEGPDLQGSDDTEYEDLL